MKTSKIDFGKFTYAEMADVSLGIAKEIKRRNSIGVNVYIPHLLNACGCLVEISDAEKENFTSECGPKEPA